MDEPNPAEIARLKRTVTALLIFAIVGALIIAIITAIGASPWTSLALLMGAFGIICLMTACEMKPRRP